MGKTIKTIAFILTAALQGQLTPPPQITATVVSSAPGHPVSTRSIPTPPVRPATVLGDPSCAWRADGLYEVGDVIPCAVVMNQKVRGDTIVGLTYGDPAWSGPATVTVLNATASATFSITAVAPSATPVAMLAIPMSIREDGQAAQHFVAITPPCCARADQCGLPADQVAQEPCAIALDAAFHP